MGKLLIVVCLAFLLASCTQVHKTSLMNLDSPILLQAIRNYLPKDVEMQPSYTIYAESKWDCKYKNDKGDYVCCNKEAFSTLSPWKYCLLVDNDYAAFAFIELGSGEYILWSEGKQKLFKKNDK